VKVLITGSAGYLGRNVAAEALRRGHEVVAFDLKLSGLMHDSLTEVAGDITDYDALLGACLQCDTVFHLAAALAQFEPDEQRMHRVNVNGTANTLAAAQASGANKFVFISSVEVYGTDVPVPCPEDAPLRPEVQYGKDKVEGEELCWKYLERGLDVTTFRPPTINGPGQNEPFLISQMEAIYRGKATLMPGGGKTRLQMVHVDDVASAIFLAAQKPAASGAIMNLGSDDVPTLKELAQALYGHAGTREKFININPRLARTAVKFLDRFGVSPLKPQHLEIALRDYVFDNTRAKELLGWVPAKTDVEAALEAYDWYIEKVAQK
jgi:UDP-glucose 4-epimerase